MVCSLASQLVRLHDYRVSSGRAARLVLSLPSCVSLCSHARHSSLAGFSTTNHLLCWCTNVYIVWHQNIWRERVFSCPLYMVDHTSVPLAFRSKIAHCFHGSSGVLLVWPYLVEHCSSSAMVLITDTRTVQVFPQGVTVCLRDCHRTRLSDSSLLFVPFEVSVYYYYYYYYWKSWERMERLMFRAGVQLKTIVQQNRIETKWQNRNALKQKRGFPVVSRHARNPARNLRASQFMGPRDSTTMGWKMYWCSSVLYFATLRVAANCHHYYYFIPLVVKMPGVKIRNNYASNTYLNFYSSNILPRKSYTSLLQSHYGSALLTHFLAYSYCRRVHLYLLANTFSRYIIITCLSMRQNGTRRRLPSTVSSLALWL